MPERKVDVEFTGWEIKPDQRGYFVQSFKELLQERNLYSGGNLEDLLIVFGFSSMPTPEGGIIIERYFSDDADKNWMTALLSVSKYMPKGLQIKVKDKITSNEFLVTLEGDRVVPKKIN